MPPVTQATEALTARTYAVINQKGGAGKTTSSVTLAAYLASQGHRVRLIDADSSASASFWLTGQRVAVDDAKTPTLLDVFFGRRTLAETEIAVRPNLHLVRASDALGRVEFERPPGCEQALARNIAASEPSITLIDGPPSLGTLAVAALAAADGVIVPVRASGLDVPALIKLNETIDLVERNVNPGLSIEAVLLTDAMENKLSTDLFRQLRDDYPEAAVRRIRHGVRAAEAPTVHEPLTEYSPRCNPMLDYIAVADLLMSSAVSRG